MAAMVAEPEKLRRPEGPSYPEDLEQKRQRPLPVQGSDEEAQLPGRPAPNPTVTRPGEVTGEPYVSPLAMPELPFSRTTSGGLSALTPGSPAWTTVCQRRTGSKQNSQAIPPMDLPPAEPAQLGRNRTAGNADDLYYNQKEGNTKARDRNERQSWNTKSKRKTEYQVEKRREQSSRDKSANITEDDLDDGD